MTILDLDQLATVTGGTCGAQQAPDASQQAQDPSGAAAAGGQGMLAGIDQLLQLFQSSNFQQLIGGLRQLLGQMGGQQGGDPSQAGAQQQAAPQAGGQ